MTDDLAPCPVCGSPPRRIHTPRVGWRIACCVAAEQHADPGEAHAAWNFLVLGVALLRACEQLQNAPAYEIPILGAMRPDWHLLSEHGSDRWLASGSGRLTAKCNSIADAIIALAAKLVESGDA